jgi:Ca2+-binding RTX toxin-like protein
MGRLGSLFSLTVLGLASFGSLPAEADRDYRLCDGKRVTITAKSNDVTTQGTGKADVIAGTNGRDDIFSNGGNDTICGLDGEDAIFGGGGDDRLFGDGEVDELNGGPGDDLLHGGANSAAALYTDADEAVVVDLAAGTATSGGDGDTLKKITDVVGSEHNDNLAGDGGGNQVFGHGGDDVVRGRGGSDRVGGEEGDDLIEGGPGQDDLFGGAGSDVASYKGSPSGIDATLDHVDEFGTGPDEDLDGFEGLVGTNFDDILSGDDGNNNLSGLDGEDALFGYDGIDRLDGGAGSDTLEGYSGDDLIIGGSNDPVTAHGPVAQLGDLRYVSGDIVVYDEYNGDVTADLQEGTATLSNSESDSLEGIESVLGSFVGDSDLTGDERDNVLIGWDGFDALKGAGGNDALYGYAGDDALVGGLGNDYLEGADGDDHLVPGGGPSQPPFTGPDNDIVSGGAHASVTGDNLDYFYAPAAVTVNLANGSASGEGTDQISGIEWVNGSAFNDTLIGNDLTNILSGGLGNDTLDAGGGNDEIDGGAGNDDTADGGEGGEGPSELPVIGDSCIKVETHVNCEYVDGVSQESRQQR